MTGPAAASPAAAPSGGEASGEALGGASGASGRSSSAGADLRGFASVDRSDSPQALFRALDEGRAASGMLRIEAEIMRRLRLSTARRVLDVGCGLGADALAMARALPPGGRVVGIDLSRRMVAEARRRTRAAAEPVDFLVGSVTRLPFADASFDRCRAQTILQHVADVPGAVAEIARVLRPGGRVVALEFDLGATILDHPDRATTRLILDGVADAALHGWIGRQLPRVLRDAGFVQVEPVARVVLSEYEFFMFTLRRPVAQLVRDGVIDARRAVTWIARLRDMHAAGHFLAGSLAVLACGVRG